MARHDGLRRRLDAIAGGIDQTELRACGVALQSIRPPWDNDVLEQLPCSNEETGLFALRCASFLALARMTNLPSGMEECMQIPTEVFHDNLEALFFGETPTAGSERERELAKLRFEHYLADWDTAQS